MSWLAYLLLTLAAGFIGYHFGRAVEWHTYVIHNVGTAASDAAMDGEAYLKEQIRRLRAANDQQSRLLDAVTSCTRFNTETQTFLIRYDQLALHSVYGQDMAKHLERNSRAVDAATPENTSS